MKIPSLKPLVRSRYLLALLAGLLLASSFPNIGLAGFAWIAPGLMLAIALDTRGGKSFRLGYVAGLVHYLASLYWLLLIPFRWHGIPFGPALGWMALSAFMALFPATWVWLAVKVSGGRGQVPGENRPAMEGLMSLSWSRRAAWAFSCAAIWVALEMLIARIFGGFPWNLLGAAEYRLVPLIQVASFTGIYGVSFLVVWTSVSLLNAVVAILRRPALRSVWIGEAIFPMAAVFAVYAFGFHRQAQTPAPQRELRITLVQPGIPQTLIWDSDRDMERFGELIRRSEESLARETDLLIWPEGATPGWPRYQPAIAGPISDLARSHHVWMIIGADDVAMTDTATNYFNASLLINPEGKLAGLYHKRGLVIFGEYIPFEHTLPFIKWLTPEGQGSFTPGERPVPFELGELHAKTSVLICFEDVFPHLVREYVEPDTDFLVNITNDGWFGEGAAQWQQAASAVYRAVENGVPLVRCSNTGLTCWIDAHGEMREVFRDRSGSVYGAGFMTVKIPLRPMGENRPPTFYTRHGDRFGWGCVGLAALALIGNVVRKNGNRVAP